MSEWMVDIQTGEGVTSDVGVLERFRNSLDAARGMTGAAASIDTASGQLSAAFAVAAEDAVSATQTGVATFLEALATTGLSATQPARVAVELVATAETVPA